MSNKIFNMIAGLEAGNLADGSLVSSVQNSKSKALYNAAPAGYEQTIDTLTTIKQEVIQQKFYQFPIADYVPVKVGEGAFSNEFLYYTSFELSGKFEEGIMGQGTGTRKPKSDVAYDAKRLPTFFWAKEVDYSMVEVNQAAKNMGSAISLITQREQAQKKNWDLGLQKVSVLGVSGLGMEGLLNLSGVTNNTAAITKSISSMTSTEINDLVKDLLDAYAASTNETELPNTFIVPSDDYRGLSQYVTGTGFFNKTKLQVLLEAFQAGTDNPNFAIKSLAYAKNSRSGLGVERYVLYKNDSQTLEMNIPIDYTSTSFGTSNSFDFSSVAYGQFTGVIAKRPKEILYFSY